jgi:hypothetical protein
MKIKSLSAQTLAGGLLLLSACDAVQNASNDLNRLVNPSAHVGPNVSVPHQAQAVKSAAKPALLPEKPASTEQAALKQPGKSDTLGEASTPTTVNNTVNLIGRSEDELRALFGPPTSVEERAPGKTWRYRDGQCTLDVQLYPDVQTRQYGTLAYEVKSDDDTDEGNRACLAHLRSRAQSGG